MKTLRAILLGALVWLFIFVEISITMIGLKLTQLVVWAIHYIVLIPIGIFCVWLYYKSGDKLNGFALGLVMLITGIVLDLIVTVPLFILPQGGGYSTYFSNYYMLAGFVELILIAGIYGAMRK